MIGQKEQILEYLKEKGSITQNEATYYLGITRLASRVGELRQKGYPIIAERENRFGQKCHWARYRMGGGV